MTSVGKDSLKTQRTLAVGNRNYEYFSLPVAEQKLGGISRLPISLKILLENILRLEDGRAYTVEHAQAIAGWPKKRTSTQEVAFRPARILMQDFTGVPAIVDLAAMRDGIVRLGGKPETINPLVPVDLVIDHSVTVDFYARNDAMFKNVDVEFVRNDERYAFLRWERSDRHRSRGNAFSCGLRRGRGEAGKLRSLYSRMDGKRKRLREVG
jgi:aconitate hydratase